MDSGLLVLQLIIGVVCCLFGLKFQKVIIALIGCVIGYLIGDYLVNMFTITGGLSLVLKFGLGLVFGAFSFSLFELLFAIIVGIELFIIIGNMFGNMWYGYVIGLLVGILGGLFTKKFYKIGIILCTALIGSHLVADSIISYLNYSYILVFGVIFIVSVLFQVSINKVKLL